MPLDKHLIARMLLKEFCPNFVPFQIKHLKVGMSKSNPQWPVSMKLVVNSYHWFQCVNNGYNRVIVLIEYFQIN